MYLGSANFTPIHSSVSAMYASALLLLQLIEKKELHIPFSNVLRQTAGATIRTNVVAKNTGCDISSSLLDMGRRSGK